jgi:hypothetical protein
MLKLKRRTPLLLLIPVLVLQIRLAHRINHSLPKILNLAILVRTAKRLNRLTKKKMLTLMKKRKSQEPDVLEPKEDFLLERL